MKVVILGAGIVGFQIANQLISEGKDVVLIEKDSARAKFVSNNLDCMVINEEGTNIHTLKRSGIRNADFFISVTNSDEVNMIACGIVSSEFNVPVKIARVRNVEYSNAKIIEKTFLGIDYVINSEVETSKAIADTVEQGALSNVLIFDESDMQMRNFITDKNSFFKDKTLREIRTSFNEQFLISGILRSDQVIIPSGNTQIKEGDNIYVLAKKESFKRIYKKTGYGVEDKITKIVIIGGGRIGAMVARGLIDRNKKITIIENNYSDCKVLSEKFPEALIIHGDVTEEKIFEEEQLATYDLIITTTDDQELNVLSAVYAKTMGTKRAVSLITNSNYHVMASKLGIDAIISPKDSTVDAILKCIRKGNITNVHSLFGDKAEVIQFTIDENSPIANKSLRELELPPNSLILTIIRDDLDYIPDGNFEIMPGDSVIAITNKNSIAKLEAVIFA